MWRGLLGQSLGRDQARLGAASRPNYLPPLWRPSVEPSGGRAPARPRDPRPPPSDGRGPWTSPWCPRRRFRQRGRRGYRGAPGGREFRATLLVLRSGPSSSYIFLFRKPPIATVAEQVLATGTGGINIAACRVETPKSTTERPLSRGSAASTARDGDGIRLSDHSGLVVQIEEAVS